MKNNFEELIAKDKAFLKFYNIKKRIFPIFDLLKYFPTSGKLVDLGCGNGIFPALMGMKNPHLQIVAIDNDEKKINIAKQIFRKLYNIEFIKKDIINLDYPSADHFSIIDVFYLIPFNEQENIIKEISEKIDNGFLLIKEMDKTPFYKYIFNYLQETVSVKILKRTLGGEFYFRSAEEYNDILSYYGFKTEIIRLDKGYLYPHILIKGLKR